MSSNNFSIGDYIRSLPLEEKSYLDHFVNEKKFRKKEIIHSPNESSLKIFYIVEGGVRKFKYKEDKEITLDFFFEDEVIIPVNTHRLRPDYYLQTIQDSVLYQIALDNFERAKKASQKLQFLDSRVVELAYEQALSRLEDFQFLNATERYLKLMKKSPRIVKHIQLQHIASYLGINNASLSKIRAKL
ncbi:MAG: Crp/Fnr family transcriptional regulator [Bacteroidia bacterium]|nr:Crp/Fnr family transcriptional regulator [Bacteroidia bacterium]